MADGAGKKGDEAAPSPYSGSAASLIALQASSRLVSTVFAQLQIRLTSAEAFGVAHIHLELLLGTIVAIAREGVRNALSRNTISPSGKEDSDAARDRERAIRNVAWLPIPVGLLISIVCVNVYRLYLAPAELAKQSDFTPTCVLFCLGIALELLSEPLYIAALRSLHLSPRIAAEGAATIAKGASTLATMVYLQSRRSDLDGGSSLLPFGVGQLFFGAVFLAVFVVDSVGRLGAKETVSLCTFHRPSGASATFDADSVRLSRSLVRQSVVKHVLGEADKFAVARFTSLSEQGAYALASNYASIVARILYQPIEESARLTFAATLGNTKATGTGALQKGQMNVQTGKTLLRTLLAFYGLFALFLVTFCPPLTTPLLAIIAGQRWAVETSAPAILAAYGATYLPAMAFNGLLEGFLQACASPAELARYDAVLMGASITYVIVVAFISQSRLIQAEIGLIFASTISSLIRAAYSYQFAVRYFQQHEQDRSPSASSEVKLRNLLPSRLFVAQLTCTGVALYANASRIRQGDWRLPWQRDALSHVLLGTTLAFFGALSCWLFERQTLLSAFNAVSGSRRKAKTE